MYLFLSVLFYGGKSNEGKRNGACACTALRICINLLPFDHNIPVWFIMQVSSYNVSSPVAINSGYEVSINEIHVYT